MTEPKDPWKRLVEASKTAPKDEGSSEPPPRISIENLRKSVQSLVLALTWRRWSLLAALLAGIIFLVFFFVFHDDSPSPEPIIPSEPPADPAAP